MMTRFRWINLFVIILSTAIISSVITVTALRNQIKIVNLFSLKINQVPFIVYVALLLLLVSFVISLFLYYGLRVNQRAIVQKLQWLIVGNYTHDVFKNNQKNRHMVSDYLGVIDVQIDALSVKLQDISQDLNEWSAKNKPLTMEQRSQIVEEERKRIARELHDSVSQQLYATTMLVSAAKHVIQHKDRILEQLNVIEKTINSAQQELRALLLHLRPVSLENKTLAQGLRLLMSELKTKVAIDVVFHIEDVSLSQITEEQLFRIVQELISNVLRHANATKIELYFLMDNGKIKLRVVDNGKGFDTTQTPLSSYGLKNIKERVSGMGGQVAIVSVMYQGTSVDITI